jgi:hypothetical protein
VPPAMLGYSMTNSNMFAKKINLFLPMESSLADCTKSCDSGSIFKADGCLHHDAWQTLLVIVVQTADRQVLAAVVVGQNLWIEFHGFVSIVETQGALHAYG